MGAPPELEAPVSEALVKLTRLLQEIRERQGVAQAAVVSVREALLPHLKMVVVEAQESLL